MGMNDSTRLEGLINYMELMYVILSFSYLIPQNLAQFNDGSQRIHNST